MFDRFTDHARHAMGLSRQEAQRLAHDYIGTEHMLLALVRMEECEARDIFRNLDVHAARIIAAVEKRIEHGTTMVTMGQLPFTPRAKKVLEYSLEEADNLGHNYIGTEHLLLGLIREGEGVAAAALSELMRVEDVREETVKLLSAEPSTGATPAYDPAEALVSELKRLKETNEELRKRVEELERRLKELGDG